MIFIFQNSDNIKISITLDLIMSKTLPSCTLNQMLVFKKLNIIIIIRDAYQYFHSTLDTVDSQLNVRK